MAEDGPRIGKAYVQIIPTTKGIKKNLENVMSDAGSASGSSFAGAFGKVALAGIGAATAAISGAVMASVNAGLDFDATMSEVGAISGATGESFDALREKAQFMGATTKFSATESAEALTYMAMAGWKTEDMLNGIEGIMNLAAASGEDLALTSDIVTDALTAFGLAAKDSGHFADVLAAASSNANTNVSMLGGSFKYAAPVAGALGYSVEDTAVALGLMANAGIKADMAGTALRGMFSRLAAPTKSSGTAMENLGISLTDAGGNMYSLMELMQQLRTAFADLDEEDAALNASLLAGQEAMSGLLSIVNASDEDFKKLTDAIYGADGAAQQMSATMQNNLQGDITIMKSAIEGFEIAVSDTLTSSLREIVQFGADSISELTLAFKSDGAEGAVEAFGEILTRMIAGVVERLPEVVTLATKLLGTLGNGIIENLPMLAESAVQIITTLAIDLGESLQTLIPAIVDIMLQIVDTLTEPEQLDMLIETALTLISGLAEGLLAALPKLVEALPEIIRSISRGLVEHMPEIDKLGIEIVVQVIGGIVKSIPELLLCVLELAGLAISALIEGFKTVGDIGKNLISGLWDGIKSKTDWIKQKISGFCDGLLDGIKGFFGIHSPSKVMADIVGKNLALGIGEGFSDSIDTVSRDMAGNMDGVLRDVTGDVSLNARITRAAQMDAQSIGEFGGGEVTMDPETMRILRSISAGGQKTPVIQASGSLRQLVRLLFPEIKIVEQLEGESLIV